MKQRTKANPLRQEGDSKKMRQAIEWAELHELEIVRTTIYCIQIEGYNFWPDKGTIQFDDQPKCKERELDGLAKLLKQPSPRDPEAAAAAWRRRPSRIDDELDEVRFDFVTRKASD